MPRLHPPLSAASLLLAGLGLSCLGLSCLGLAQPAWADTPGPTGLVGAWGDDSSCTADVAVFRADGSVVPAGAAPDAPPTSYTVNGNTITFTQGSKSGEFAFGLTGQAVAWSNGSIMVLKERCADQTPYAATLNSATTTAQPAATTPPALDPKAPLLERVKALAAFPATFNGVAIKMLSVTSTPAAAPGHKGPSYAEVVAEPDPAAVGAGARLIYRVFPDEAAAEAHVSLSAGEQGSFLHAGSGPGYFATEAARDEGPAGGEAAPITIACLRFHPRGQQSVTITCFAHMPGTPLVVGGAQSFPLPKDADKRAMGPKEDLSETLDLTGIAIAQARQLLAAAAAQKP